jgi:hypothetical protein
MKHEAEGKHVTVSRCVFLDKSGRMRWVEVRGAGAASTVEKFSVLTT